jgi:hypothetical protein
MNLRYPSHSDLSAKRVTLFEPGGEGGLGLAVLAAQSALENGGAVSGGGQDDTQPHQGSSWAGAAVTRRGALGTHYLTCPVLRLPRGYRFSEDPALSTPVTEGSSTLPAGRQWTT